MMIMRVKKSKKELMLKARQCSTPLEKKSLPVKKYKYESRHNHAIKRERGPNGRFLKSKFS